MMWPQPEENLTGVGVQTEATSAVARLEPVRHAAIFTLVVISSHHVQNHKPASEDTDKLSQDGKHEHLLVFKLSAIKVTTEFQLAPHPTGWSSMMLTADGELKTGALSFSSVTKTRAVTEPQRLWEGSTAWSVARTTRKREGVDSRSNFCPKVRTPLKGSTVRKSGVSGQ